jgi:hypothetical protein
MHPRRIITLAAVLIVLAAGAAPAAEESPVIIGYDPAAAHIDLVTGKPAPACTQAVRGSILFYKYRLDKPDEFFNFYHDGIQTARPSQLARMEKVQPQFSIWRLRYIAGNKNTPRIHHQAVSFVPLQNGVPGPRIFLMLDDLNLIDWGTE